MYRYKLNIKNKEIIQASNTLDDNLHIWLMHSFKPFALIPEDLPVEGWHYDDNTRRRWFWATIPLKWTHIRFDFLLQLFVETIGNKNRHSSTDNWKGCVSIFVLPAFKPCWHCTYLVWRSAFATTASWKAFLLFSWHFCFLISIQIV